MTNFDMFSEPREKGRSEWKTFNDATLREHVEYAQRTGFDEFYLWGVEWWYWIKLQGHPEVWD